MQRTAANGNSYEVDMPPLGKVIQSTPAFGSTTTRRNRAETKLYPAGMSDTTTMPTITSSKCALTVGQLPNQYPVPMQIPTHETAATRLKKANRTYVIDPAPATKGTNVRMIGMNCPSTTAFP